MKLNSYFSLNFVLPENRALISILLPLQMKSAGVRRKLSKRLSPLFGRQEAQIRIFLLRIAHIPA